MNTPHQEKPNAAQLKTKTYTRCKRNIVLQNNNLTAGEKKIQLLHLDKIRRKLAKQNAKTIERARSVYSRKTELYKLNRRTLTRSEQMTLSTVQLVTFRDAKLILRA